ncbi:mannose-1-phosphate guanylyltransferase [Leucobacter sp. UCD-THU]|uniref:Mannose-1-phosphate guanylyltransferase n=1 Tax=Leucobacter muris TaxID=1935379 RepID=A0ABX5QIS6_9MICO|nr:MULTISPECIES: mannose-1-phosphate guanylyltransferase [Leucobacter]EYT55285.1 mannose-1-phosphate guanylyltransferase [Leucobacter sp. UCD-THU]QAB18834.1 mannose-1-phosphate guanylyltransferase [Leucobacter muris]
MSDATVPRPAVERLTCVIPAGGVGSRLWPLSRANAPKFLLDLTGSGDSLLRATWDRLSPIAPAERVMVVTGVSHRDSVMRQLPELLPQNLITESEPKDSSAAIGLAAALLELRDPDAILGSFAADHVIRGDVLFQRAVTTAVQAADRGYIATIGIHPSHPATGFGYISCGEARGDLAPFDVYDVSEFVEKPDAEQAEEYLSHGGYLWNAGMFIARATVLLDQMALADPELVSALREIAASWDTDRGADVRERLWPALPKIAIDYTVAEPAAAAGKMVCVAAHFDWDDVGDFASVANLLTRGRGSDLAVLGDGAQVLSDASSGIVVSESERLVALVGVEDVVVVDTADVLLVTTKSRAQDVKNLVNRMKLAGGGHLL